MIATELNIDFFFAKPFASWQRGSNENYNRLVRLYYGRIEEADFADKLMRMNYNIHTGAIL